MPTGSVHQHFTDDHRRLDRLMQTFRSQKHSDFAAASNAFHEFQLGLRRHIVWEEELLFPFFEKASQGGFGPTQVMREEHRLIKEALEGLHAKIRRSDPDCDAQVQKLMELLSVHNRKEESILYPMFDDTLDAEERARLFQQMEDLPPERYTGCCT
jgi:iron-sulfur cluster repair protein YtfE (RIC family)